MSEAGATTPAGGAGPISDGAPHALIVSIVHTPLDARIHYRQIAALRDAGWRVTQIAPWTSYGLNPPPGIAAVDVPRAAGRHRLKAILAARRAIAQQSSEADIVVLHDPELLASVAFLKGRPPTVWDVHEDTAGALSDKAWLPGWLAPVLAPVVRLVERLAEWRLHLLLAEEGYRERFAREHPVVANHPYVPDEVAPPDDPRVVYVGRISIGRGIRTILEAARRMDGIEVELIGTADDDVEGELQAAVDAGEVTWHGFLPNDEALARIEGAMAGLSLLRDEPNYRSSMPTKVVEYLARGVPAVTTPLPRAVRIVEPARAGLVVPFDDASAVVAAVGRLRDDPDERRAMARRGRDVVAREHSWEADAQRFVALLDRWAREGR